MNTVSPATKPTPQPSPKPAENNQTAMTTHLEVINDWYPETKSPLDRLVAAGCEIVSGDNGEEKFKFDGDFDKFIAELTACDESYVYLKTPSGKVRWIYLVYGNSPGELPSDYIVDPTFDAVTSAHYAEWELKGQPKKRGYYDRSQGYKFIISDTLPR